MGMQMGDEEGEVDKWRDSWMEVGLVSRCVNRWRDGALEAGDEHPVG